jgi:hypothetical protein
VQRFFSRRGGIFFEQFNGFLSFRGRRWSGPRGEGEANPLAEARRRRGIFLTAARRTRRRVDGLVGGGTTDGR